MLASREQSAPRCRPEQGQSDTWGTSALPSGSAAPTPPGRISTGDQMRLQRLREIKAMLERKRQLRQGLAGGGGGADDATAGNVRRPARGPPAAMAGRMSARAQHAASAAQASPARPRPPLPPDRVLSPAVSGASLRRNVALELFRVRRRALRSGNVVQLNLLRTDAGLAAFERALRIRAHAQVQRRFNGIRSAGAAGGSHSVFPQREIETQTEEAAAGASGAPEEWREDEEWTRAMLACDEQALENLAEADLAYLEMVRTKSGLHHQTAGALATSKAEQALAESWQQLIMLRLKSQKLQLQQQAFPMSPAQMKAIEADIMRETSRIASFLQDQLQSLNGMRAAAAADTAQPPVGEAGDECGGVSSGEAVPAWPDASPSAPRRPIGSLGAPRPQPRRSSVPQSPRHRSQGRASVAVSRSSSGSSAGGKSANVFCNQNGAFANFFSSQNGAFANIFPGPSGSFSPGAARPLPRISLADSRSSSGGSGAVHRGVAPWNGWELAQTLRPAGLSSPTGPKAVAAPRAVPAVPRPASAKRLKAGRPKSAPPAARRPKRPPDPAQSRRATRPPPAHSLCPRAAVSPADSLCPHAAVSPEDSLCPADAFRPKPTATATGDAASAVPAGGGGEGVPAGGVGAGVPAGGGWTGVPAGDGAASCCGSESASSVQRVVREATHRLQVEDASISRLGPQVRQLYSSAARGASASDQELRGLHAALSHSHSWLAALQRELALLGFHPTGDTAGPPQAGRRGGRGVGLSPARQAPALAGKGASHCAASDVAASFGEPAVYFAEPDAGAKDPDLARLVCGGRGDTELGHGLDGPRGGVYFEAGCYQHAEGCAAEGDELFGGEAGDLDKEMGSEEGLWVDACVGDEEDDDDLGWIGCAAGLDAAHG